MRRTRRPGLQIPNTHIWRDSAQGEESARGIHSKRAHELRCLHCWPGCDFLTRRTLRGVLGKNRTAQRQAGARCDGAPSEVGDVPNDDFLARAGYQQLAAAARRRHLVPRVACFPRRVIGCATRSPVARFQRDAAPSMHPSAISGADSLAGDAPRRRACRATERSCELSPVAVSDSFAIPSVLAAMSVLPAIRDSEVRYLRQPPRPPRLRARARSRGRGAPGHSPPTPAFSRCVHTGV